MTRFDTQPYRALPRECGAELRGDNRSRRRSRRDLRRRGVGVRVIGGAQGVPARCLGARLNTVAHGNEVCVCVY